MVLALDTQSSFSLVEMNSVGLKSGFLAAFAELTLSSYFWEIVERIVFPAGISMASAALLLPFMVEVVEVDEAELEEEDDELEEEDEQSLVSESESE